MLLFFLIGFITLFRKKYVDFKSVIISMGILGTFIGIFSGLLEFNTMEIKKSIPPYLLGRGLKTRPFLNPPILPGKWFLIQIPPNS